MTALVKQKWVIKHRHCHHRSTLCRFAAFSQLGDGIQQWILRSEAKEQAKKEAEEAARKAKEEWEKIAVTAV